MRRSPLRTLPGSRTLLAAGLAAAVVFVPGTAYAQETPTVPTDVAAVVPAFGDGAPDDTGTAGSQLATPTMPPELAAALAQLTTAMGVPEDCATGVQTAIGLVVAGLTEPPAGLEDLLAAISAQLAALADSGTPDPAALQGLADQIQDFLAGGAAATSSSASTSTPPADEPKIVQGLKLLAQTLSEDCRPAQGAGGTASRPNTTARAATSSDSSDSSSPSATPTATQQAVYPGYAPTGGAGAEEASSAGPLATLGAAVLLLGAATAVGYRRRGRAIRPEG